MLGVRPAPDDHQCRPVHPAADVGQRLDQHVLTLAWHQPGNAHRHRPLAQPVTGAQFGPGSRIRSEPPGVDARRQRLEVRARAEGGGKPATGVPTHVGHHVGAVPDAPQCRTGSRQHRPPNLVSVRTSHDPLRPGPPGPGGQQCQRRSGPEPHRFDAVLADESPHPTVHSRLGQHQRAGVPDDWERGGAVVVVGTLPLRGVDGQLMALGRGQPGGELLKIGLNTTAARRKVVGDQQDPCHRPKRLSVVVGGYRFSHAAHRACNSVRSTSSASRTAHGKSPCPGPQAAPYSRRSPSTPKDSATKRANHHARS